MDHVSITQIAMYAKCPEQWRRRYLEGEIRPPGIAALVGGGLHKGAEMACRHKAERGENLPAGDVRDVAVAGFDTRLEADDVHLGPDERAAGRSSVVGAGRDLAAAYGHYWGVAVQPEYVPLADEYIEWRCSMPLSSLGIDLVGVVDLVTDSHRVVDWKTGTRRLSQRDADASLQLLAYSMAAARTFRRPTEATFDQLVFGSSGTSRNTVAMRGNGLAGFSRLLMRVTEFVRAVRSGAFPPCDPTSWWCSRRWCGYAETCRYYVPESEGG